MTIRPAPPKITLDRVRPTVVRRRVFENSPAQSPGFTEAYDDEDSGPPSSVNVARALASLRGHELKRLDEILTRDDEEAEVAPPAAPPPAPAAPTVPTVRIGPAIALTELARRMSVSQEELVTALVTRGFFDVTVKTTLSRETARAGATIFGWAVEDTDEPLPSSPATPKAAKKKATAAKAKSTKTSRIAKPKAKAQAKAGKPRAAATSAAPSATSKRRRTSRRA